MEIPGFGTHKGGRGGRDMLLGSEKSKLTPGILAQQEARESYVFQDVHKRVDAAIKELEHPQYSGDARTLAIAALIQEDAVLRNQHRKVTDPEKNRERAKAALLTGIEQVRQWVEAEPDSLAA